MFSRDELIILAKVLAKEREAASSLADTIGTARRMEVNARAGRNGERAGEQARNHVIRYARVLVSMREKVIQELLKLR